MNEAASLNDGSKRLVNKVVYLLITFFLGGLGIHKFYSGKNAKGVLYLLFFWTCVPALLALVEFFIVLFKKADPDGNILV